MLHASRVLNNHNFDTNLISVCSKRRWHHSLTCIHTNPASDRQVKSNVLLRTISLKGTGYLGDKPLDNMEEFADRVGWWGDKHQVEVPQQQHCGSASVTSLSQTTAPQMTRWDKLFLTMLFLVRDAVMSTEKGIKKVLSNGFAVKFDNVICRLWRLSAGGKGVCSCVPQKLCRAYWVFSRPEYRQSCKKWQTSSWSFREQLGTDLKATKDIFWLYSGWVLRILLRLNLKIMD